MAQSGAQLDAEVFCCCLCLELLKDPVTIPCGHSYCRECLQHHWDTEEEKRVCSCPQCRRTFTPRPVLEKNIMLAALVETLEMTELQAALAGHCYAGTEDVACDFCTGRKLKALKSCLDCQVSYCASHLQPHLDVVPLQKHKLVEPTKELQQNVCPHHDEVMRLFCRTDQQKICSLCSVDEHQGHHIVAAAAERTERQTELEETRQEIQQRIQHTEEEVKVLQKTLKAINDSADKAVEDREKLLTQMIHLLEKRHSEVEQQVRSMQEAEVGRVKDLQRKLEQEITELKRRDAELEKISYKLDQSQFLHNFSSLLTLSVSPESPRHLQPGDLRYFEEATAAMSKLRDKIQEVLTERLTDVSWTVSNVDVLLSKPEPRSREDFLRYSCQINFDPNTANTFLLLTEGNRKVIHLGKYQPYRDHPDRFTYWPQVLSTDSLTGRCYWEVEWGGWSGIAVAYRNIRRAGGSIDCEFGLNDNSWSLFCSSGIYRFYHKNMRNDVSGPKSSRVGVYLDHSEGLLCFYSISTNMELLHKVQTTFTQPLYAGLLIGLDSFAKLVV